MNRGYLLLVDVGNTRVKWAYARKGVLSDVEVHCHCGDTASMFAGTSDRRIDSIWVSDVTDSGPRTKLRSRLRSFGGVNPHFVVSEVTRLDLVNGYAQPQQLGTDRWMMLLAAWKEVRGPFCVVCAGTALTFDAVDERGQHLGGIIAPGLHAMQSAILNSTKFSFNGRPPGDYTLRLGLDTSDCVHQGVLHAAAGLVTRLIGLQPSDATLFLTGGDASIIRSILNYEWIWRPNLVLEGLMSVAIDTATS